MTNSDSGRHQKTMPLASGRRCYANEGHLSRHTNANWMQTAEDSSFVVGCQGSSLKERAPVLARALERRAVKWRARVDISCLFVFVFVFVFVFSSCLLVWLLGGRREKRPRSAESRGVGRARRAADCERPRSPSIALMAIPFVCLSSECLCVAKWVRS